MKLALRTSYCESSCDYSKGRIFIAELYQPHLWGIWYNGELLVGDEEQARTELAEMWRDYDLATDAWRRLVSSPTLLSPTKLAAFLAVR